MIEIGRSSIVLESRPGIEFENEGVFNPACIEKDGIIHIFYRAVRQGNFSTLGHCQIKDDQIISRPETPFMIPEYQYESHGIEDPRLTFIDGKYYLFYTAYDGQNALVAYATSNDLNTFTKQGLITPQISYDEAEDLFKNPTLIQKYIFYEKAFKQSRGNNVHLWEKDAMLFPQKINGRYALLHRILPGIQICYFDSFEELNQDFWRRYFKDLNKYIVLDPKFPFENSYIGGGCVPIDTPFGWLLIYHSAQEDLKNGQIYHACAALLDKNNPQKILGRLRRPLFSPETEWEKQGTVDNVVFPTSALVKDDILSIYYGAADTKIGLKNFSLSLLLKELLS